MKRRLLHMKLCLAGSLITSGWSLSTSSSGSTTVSSSDPWKLIEIKFKNQNLDTADLLSDYLLELGACSTTIVDHDRDTDNEAPILLAESWGVRKKLWRNSDVSAHFPATSFNAEGITESVRVAFEMSASPRYEVDGVEDKDWVLHVQESWKPCIVGGFLLRFPWHKDKHIKEAIAENASSKHNGNIIDEKRWLKLQGGMAFGTGEHPTTRLCMEWVSDTISPASDERKLFLDYGAGSGVLGLAACAIGGPNVEAVGIEIDADAIQIANINAKENHLPMKSYFPKLDRSRLDDESLSVTLRGRKSSTTECLELPIDLYEPVFDACAANILAAPLCQLAQVIAGHLKKGAALGLSGVLEYQGEDVVAAYQPYFDNCRISKEDEGWLLIEGERNGEPAGS